MFRGVHNKIALYKLDRRKKKVDEERMRVLKEVWEKSDINIYREWYETFGSRQYKIIERLQKRIVSASLIKEADELHVPTPQIDDKDKWDQDTPPGLEALNPAGMTELRAAIRNERRARRETVEWWVKIIGGLITIVTGLVGALIGLISVWKRR